MSARRLAPLGLAFALATSAASSVAGGPQKPVGLIERIVAVVRTHPILLSELRARAKPFLGSAGAGVDAHKVIQQVLEQMIDDQVVAEEADRAMITVTAAEIDAAMQAIASKNGVTVPKLLEAAKQTGLDEAAYQGELRRQLLQQKMAELRVRPRIKDYATLSDAERSARMATELRKWLDERRATMFIEVRL